MLLPTPISSRCWLVVVCAALALRPTAHVSAEETPAKKCPTYGTAISWVADADVAAKQAEKEGKLLFVMQLSGNFAKPEFT